MGDNHDELFFAPGFYDWAHPKQSMFSRSNVDVGYPFLKRKVLYMRGNFTASEHKLCVLVVEASQRLGATFITIG